MTEVTLKRDWRDRRAGRAFVPDGAVPGLIDAGYCDPPEDIGGAKGSIKADLSSQAKPEPVMGFDCSVCGRAFQTKAGLKSHMRVNHPDVPDNDDAESTQPVASTAPPGSDALHSGSFGAR